MAQKYEPKPEKINDKPAERDNGLIWGKNPVTEVLRSGNHAAIDKWRREQAIELTKKMRPDLL